MSWKPEVHVNNQWSSNAIAFETEEEAVVYAKDLFNRWTLCSDYRAVPSSDTVNYKITVTSVVGNDRNLLLSSLH